MPIPIEDVLARVPAWDGRRVSYAVLKGGLSHQIYRVTVDDENYVLRVLDPAVSRAGLGIPLDEEIENTARAADSGIGPRVVHILSDVPALVLEFIKGPTLSLDDVQRENVIPRIATSCRRLHAAPRPFVNDFSIFRKLEELVGLCKRYDLRLPDRYEDYLPTIRSIEKALAARPMRPVPCHNDLLAENFIDDGTQIRVVDYQLSGMNEPTFDLGDVAAESDFDTDQTARLVEAYFGGEMSDTLLARVLLNLAMTNYTWTLWFSIHHGLLSAPHTDFDYWDEADDKWNQAVRDLDSAEFGRLLDVAAAFR